MLSSFSRVEVGGRVGGAGDVGIMTMLLPNGMENVPVSMRLFKMSDLIVSMFLANSCMGWCPSSRNVGDGGHVAGLQTVLLHACNNQFGAPRRDVLDDKPCSWS